MKFCNISLLFVIIALICSFCHTFAQDVASPGPKRIALRRPIVGAVAKTTTTAPPPPAYDDDGDYPEENPEGENGEEGEQSAASSTTTTTTEPPKKIGPVIRPFRSNDDFLNSLKRRQMNAKKHHQTEKPTPKSRPAAGGSENGDQAEESAPAPVAPSKGFKAGSALNRRKPLKPVVADDAAAEESEQQQKEESKLKRPQTARLALRKRI